MRPTDTPASLADWLARIEGMHPAEIELGLDRLRAVAGRLAVETLSVPVITVAGTNGKGSTLRLMTALARDAGHRVCLYTSPHLIDFNERVMLPDGLASDAQLCAAFEQVEQARGEVALTYFEFTTLAALWLFAGSDADLVLLEVGLGGRLDAVNVVDPDVAVVTSVGLDHQDWLGDTREAICAEKCGIARPGRPLVYGEQDWPENLSELVRDYQANGFLAGREFAVQAGEGVLAFADGEQLRCPEHVVLGADNLATACQALKLAGVSVTQAAVDAAGSLSLMGRCEYRLLQGVDCWFDVGHNLPAVSRFRTLLPECRGQRHLVFGMMADKPLAEVAACFCGEQSRWFLCAPAMPRAATVAQLTAVLPAGESQQVCDSVAEALSCALAAANPGDQVVVFGSFYTVAEAWQVTKEGQSE
ncbi:bifunctional folylpolyglutamate synthase/dihydrofolate synthase [Alcanivorax sp. S6407]|uniref:bifunctional folylpolyglutamate synthase/dihydrofolate synthase n=1 Tax=Alcanivorax sp. S6407 TaxID=2926424 RepID=UPI001FF6CFCA|nr:folylpolyglutamate synthase/dihydrofolate synthase family protein [Alcanivorax sp. S6407]MCK0152315.1 bifunctional folylpolyglutamate synthase/dihydrofolate synthase [Alcanivorax sp. S6407]